jgi:hypothetical protein
VAEYDARKQELFSTGHRAVLKDSPMTVEIKTAEGWKPITLEEMKRKFYSVAMFYRAYSLLQQNGFLLAGANEYRRSK